MEQSPNTSLFQLNLDASNNATLRSAASWAKVLAILGLIFGILFVALAFIVQNTIKNASSSYEGLGGYRGNTSIIANAGMIVYLCFGIITIIGSIFALNFGNKISTALKTNDQNSVRTGFAGLRNYFAFWSILMIIGLLLMIISIASGSMARM
jgi:hypothetical protein